MDDDGEVELADHVQPSLSVNSYLDELLKTAQKCTHTHTCNPPGPDSTHTHTCYHTHTQILPSEEENNPGLKPKRPLGNREAVRKYREKKKAQTAYLEEEVKKLRFVNQQLIKKLQKQAVLESEISRLRGVLVSVRGKIDDELSVFPFRKQCSSTISFKEGDCSTVQLTSNAMNLQCESDLPCFHLQPGSSAEACQPPVMDCQAKVNDNGSGERRSMDSASQG